MHLEPVEAGVKDRESHCVLNKFMYRGWWAIRKLTPHRQRQDGMGAG